jgi:hypothetical protein
MTELETWSHQAQAGSNSGTNPDAPVADPDYVPASADA